MDSTTPAELTTLATCNWLYRAHAAYYWAAVEAAHQSGISWLAIARAVDSTPQALHQSHTRAQTSLCALCGHQYRVHLSRPSQVDPTLSINWAAAEGCHADKCPCHGYASQDTLPLT